MRCSQFTFQIRINNKIHPSVKTEFQFGCILLVLDLFWRFSMFKVCGLQIHFLHLIHSCNAVCDQISNIFEFSMSLKFGNGKVRCENVRPITQPYSISIIPRYSVCPSLSLKKYVEVCSTYYLILTKCT